MSKIPSELRYAKTHEWLKIEPDGTASIGITDHAQGALGDITYVQLPKVGAVLRAGEVLGAIESVKAASDLYTPVGGTVIAVNAKLTQTPETVNQGPYGDGWIAKLKVANPSEAGALLDAPSYEALLG
jgi:glycine cleavage system H protein